MKRTQAENAAAIPAAIPQTQTVINHAPSEAGKVLARGLTGLIVFFTGWQFAVYLVGEMGYRQPVRVLGWGLFGLAALIILVGCVYFGGTHFFALWTDYNLRLAEIHAETARSLALTAGAPAVPAERLTEEQKKLFENLAIVMEIAYRDLAEKRAPYKGGNTPPALV